VPPSGGPFAFRRAGSRAQRGWTLVELTTSLALTSVIAVLVGGLMLGAEKARDLGGAYAQDVAESRRALDAIERDVRGARDVRTAGGTLVVTAADEHVSYAVAGRALTRTTRGEERTLARNVAALRASRDGALVTVTLEFGRRDPNAARAAAVSTSARMRCAEDAR
jgi:hypothetical protein